jgi:hypothetical protein
MSFNPDKIKIFTSETRFSENFDKQKKYLEKINKIKNNLAPKEENFIGVYSEEDVQRDIDYVNRLE